MYPVDGVVRFLRFSRRVIRMNLHLAFFCHGRERNIHLFRRRRESNSDLWICRRTVSHCTSRPRLLKQYIPPTYHWYFLKYFSFNPHVSYSLQFKNTYAPLTNFFFFPIHYYLLLLPWAWYFTTASTYPMRRELVLLEDLACVTNLFRCYSFHSERKTPRFPLVEVPWFDLEMPHFSKTRCQALCE